MDFVTYLTTPTNEFGGPQWVFFIVEGVATLVGVYLAFLRPDSHPVRGAALRNLGLALLVLGGLGVLAGALRLAAIAPFTMPIWFYVVGLLEVALLVYAVYYWQARYPALMAAYAQQARSAGSRRVVRPQPALESNGNGVSYGAPRPAATTSRRGSRRDRKRRSR
jgi:hypothetical protein